MWRIHAFCLGDERIVAARMATTMDQLEVAVIWNPCAGSTMGHCHQLYLYRYTADEWRKQWQAVAGIGGWPYSDTEAYFADAGIDQIKVKNSSWPA